MQFRLREARKAAGMSQKAAAEALNTTQQQIAKYETGAQEIPLYRAVELAKLYGCSLDYLAGLEDVPTHPFPKIDPEKHENT